MKSKVVQITLVAIMAITLTTTGIVYANDDDAKDKLIAKLQNQLAGTIDSYNKAINSSNYFMAQAQHLNIELEGWKKIADNNRMQYVEVFNDRQILRINTDATISDLNDQISELNNQINELNKKLQSVQNSTVDTTALNEKITKLQDDKKDLIEKREKLQDDKQNLRETINELKAENSKLKDDKKELKQENKKQQKQIDRLKGFRDDVQVDVNADLTIEQLVEQMQRMEQRVKQEKELHMIEQEKERHMIEPQQLEQLEYLYQQTNNWSDRIEMLITQIAAQQSFLEWQLRERPTALITLNQTSISQGDDLEFIVNYESIQGWTPRGGERITFSIDDHDGLGSIEAQIIQLEPDYFRDHLEGEWEIHYDAPTLANKVIITNQTTIASWEYINQTAIVIKIPTPDDHEIGLHNVTLSPVTQHKFSIPATDDFLSDYYYPGDGNTQRLQYEVIP